MDALFVDIVLDKHNLEQSKIEASKMAKQKENFSIASNAVGSSDVQWDLFADIREVLNSARSRAFVAVNFAMVEAYWNVGRLIVEKQGGEERAAYGDSLLAVLSKQLTLEFGKGFTQTNLKYMRQFFLSFPIRHALRDQLSWTHYRLIMRVEKSREA